MVNDLDEKIEFDSSNLVCYCGYLLDDDKLLKSVSGGVASALAESFIKKGGVVFGVSYTSDYKNATYVIIDKIEQINLIKGSKYISAQKNVVYEGQNYLVYDLVAKKVDEKIPVLFIGLGCEVGALKKYLLSRERDLSNLYTVDLICHGPAINMVHESYIASIEKKYKSKVCNFSIRYKKAGDTIQYIHAQFNDGSVHEEPFYGSDYAYGFSVGSMMSCHNCKFKGKNHCSDITIGDFWGVQKGIDGYNPNGSSVMIVKNEKGEKMIQEIDKSLFSVFKADLDYVLRHNPMYYKCREINKKREEFINNIKARDLHYATVKAQGGFNYYWKKINLIGRTKKTVKRLLRRGEKREI